MPYIKTAHCDGPFVDVQLSENYTSITQLLPERHLRICDIEPKMAYELTRARSFAIQNTFRYEIVLVTSLDLSCSCQLSDPGPGLLLTRDQI